MTTSCPFCAYAAGRFPRDLIVYEDDSVMVVPSKDQKRDNRGHCLVVPRAHVVDIYQLPAPLAAPILQSVSAAARAAKRAFSAHGVTIRQNNEAAGGQDIFHLHVHVVPRFTGDRYETAPFEEVDEDTRIEQADALRRVWVR